jgi:NAD+ kinase
MKFALFGNIYQEHQSATIQQFFETVSKHGIELAIHDEFHDFLTGKMHMNVGETEIIHDTFSADIAVCMGGDGTFLNVAHIVADKHIPILGINTGRLGFLASVSPDSIESAITDICSGNYDIEDRSLLGISCDELDIKDYPFALNEIAILKHDIASMISIHTSINGEYLTTYQADGLIVSTPTGSTAYSLSVGGPIIVPQSDTISLTPVAPHSLNMRPILLCDNAEITLCVESRSHNFLISIDGRSHSYREKTQLHIRKAPYTIKVITTKGQSFFSTLRRKMMWGTDRRDN